MSLEDLAEEITYDDETEPVCAWNRCDVEEPLIDPATGDWWCMTHLGDELLPKLTMGRGILGCAHCGKSTVWSVSEEKAYHPACLRETAKQPTVVTKRLGAYGRRRAKE